MKANVKVAQDCLKAEKARVKKAESAADMRARKAQAQSTADDITCKQICTADLHNVLSDTCPWFELVGKTVHEPSLALAEASLAGIQQSLQTSKMCTIRLSLNIKGMSYTCFCTCTAVCSWKCSHVQSAQPSRCLLERWGSVSRSYIVCFAAGGKLQVELRSLKASSASEKASHKKQLTAKSKEAQTAAAQHTAEITTFREELIRNDRRTQAAQQQIATLKGQVSAGSQRLHDSKQAAAATSTENASVKLQLQAQAAELQTLQAQAAEHKAALDRTAQAAAATAAENEALRQQLTAQSAQLQQLQDEAAAHKQAAIIAQQAESSTVKASQAAATLSAEKEASKQQLEALSRFSCSSCKMKLQSTSKQLSVPSKLQKALQ